MFPLKSRSTLLVLIITALIAGRTFAADALEPMEEDELPNAAVEWFTLIKGTGYIQESEEEPELAHEEEPWGLFSNIDVTEANPEHTATLVLPDGDERAYMSFGFDMLGFFDLFETEEELHEAYPAGNYTINITLADAEPQAATLNLAQAEFPSIPHVLNFNDLQEIDPNSPVTIEWGPFIGGTAADYIIIDIEDMDGGTVFETPEPGQPGAIDGTATTIEIPADVFEEGRTYDMSVVFARVTDVNATDIPGATGMAGVFTFTELEVRTTGTPDHGNGIRIITSSLLPDAVFGEAYSVTLEVEGGTSPYVWTAPDLEDLPNGLELNMFAGTLSGTPLEEGTFLFTMRVFDGTFQIAEKDFVLTVLGEGDEPVTEAPLLTEIRQTEEGFSFQVSGATEGMTYTIESSTDLEQWTEILTVPATGADAIDFIDSEAADFPRRFYRVRIE